MAVFFLWEYFFLYFQGQTIAVSSVISCSCVKSSFFREKIELSPKIDLHSGSITQQSLLLHTHHTTYSLRKIHATWLLFKPYTFFIFRFLIQSPSLVVCCKAAIPFPLLYYTNNCNFLPIIRDLLNLKLYLIEERIAVTRFYWIASINFKSSWFLQQKNHIGTS